MCWFLSHEEGIWCSVEFVDGRVIGGVGGSGGEGVGGGMVNQEGGVTEPSRVRREREEENAGVGTPSKKRRHGGKSEGGEGGRDVSGKVASKAGEGGDNGVVEGNGEKNAQEGAGGGGGGGGVDLSGAAAGAPEGASRPEAPALEVYRIPSYAGNWQWGHAGVLSIISVYLLCVKRGVVFLAVAD